MENFAKFHAWRASSGVSNEGRGLVRGGARRLTRVCRFSSRKRNLAFVGLVPASATTVTGQ